MILAVDIGNTNIVLGGFSGRALKFVSRLETGTHKMEDEYAIDVKNILMLYGCGGDSFEGAVISSTVPALLPVLKRAIVKILGCRVLTISPGVKTGLNIKTDNPAVLGSDFVCCAVAAIEKYAPPCIVIDLGTATTLSGIDRDKNFVGVSIFPGVGLSVEALAARTAQLPHISLDAPGRVIGTSTEESIKSGIIYGTACMLDGMLDRYREVLGGDAVAIATGGRASEITVHCRRKITIDSDLQLEGLLLVYERNLK